MLGTTSPLRLRDLSRFLQVELTRAIPAAVVQTSRGERLPDRHDSRDPTTSGTASSLGGDRGLDSPGVDVGRPAGTPAADSNSVVIHRRLSNGSMTSSISNVDAVFSALPCWYIRSTIC
ncbi:MAG: hypothetical protein R2715_22800 [Ilumatobacteraceae bacterium]